MDLTFVNNPYLISIIFFLVCSDWFDGIMRDFLPTVITDNWFTMNLTKTFIFFVANILIRVGQNTYTDLMNQTSKPAAVNGPSRN